MPLQMAKIDVDVFARSNSGLQLLREVSILKIQNNFKKIATMIMIKIGQP